MSSQLSVNIVLLSSIKILFITNKKVESLQLLIYISREDLVYYIKGKIITWIDLYCGDLARKQKDH